MQWHTKTPRAGTKVKNKKSLGQHWLKNRAILDEIADLAKYGISAADQAETDYKSEHSTPDMNTANLCIEIGPGLGTLTSSLLRRFERVIAVEYDAELAQKLPGQFPGKQLQVEQADILDLDLAQLTAGQEYVVAGNIPYYITSPIIRKLLTTQPAPARIVLLIQKEVAERIAAEPGKHNSLSIYVQNLASIELGPVVRAAEFTPPPKVDSQVIVLTPLESPVLSSAAQALARRGFSNPRKKLASNLADQTHSKQAWQQILADHAINPDARAQDLDLWDWAEICQN